jgi:hypothetical protein
MTTPSIRQHLQHGNISLLLSDPAWPEFRDAALCYATAECDVSVVKALIENGANPVYNKDAPLYMAAENNNIEVVIYLLTIQEVRENAAAHKNRSLLAAQNNECELIEAYLMAIPDVAEGPSLHKPFYGLIDIQEDDGVDIESEELQ